MWNQNPRQTLALTFLMAALAVPARPQTLAYDPMRLEKSDAATVKDMSYTDSKRSRTLPLRLFLPASTKPAPVILFSHGLGGSRGGSAYLGQHWARRGYVVVALQHPGSDDSVWKDTPLSQRMSALRRAASGENFLARVDDVRSVLDGLTAWNKESGHPFFGRLDMARVGMSGHSFGAVTTQGVSGQSFAGRGPRFTDTRIKAAIAFSPSTPAVGSPDAAFGSVKLPWLLMTGTEDVSPIGNADAASRLLVYKSLPKGDKYELVLDGAQHLAFTDRAVSSETKSPRDPNHHRAIQAISTAFWDTYLRDDQSAKAWLNSDAVRKVLEKKDKWQWK